MLEDAILRFFKKTRGSYNLKDIEEKFDIHTNEERKQLQDALYNLQVNGKLYLNDKNYYITFPKEYRIGILEMSRDGRGRINTPEGYVNIDPCDLNDAIDRDVIVIGNISNYGNRPIAKVKRIVQRSRNYIVCEYTEKGDSYYLKPQISNKRINLTLTPKERKNLVDGDYIRIDVSLNENGNVTPTLVDRVGHRDDPDIDLKNIAAEYDITMDFTEQSLNQLKDIPSSIEGLDISNRVDLRDKEFFTIDCDNTKDMDDAVYIDGNKLYIAIADVDEFVPYGSPLYSEALDRSTSWYPEDKCIPMLPHQLSNGICSLNEGQDRFAMIYELTFDANGKMTDYDVYQGIINSKKKMSYSAVNSILEDGIVPEGYEPYVDRLEAMNRLSKKIQRLKEDRGYIDFYRPDVSYKKNDEGEIIDIVPTYQHTAEKIIENFMVQGNIAVMLYMSHIYDDAIYRVHDLPAEDKLETIAEYINGLGLDFKFKTNNLNAKKLQRLLYKLKDKEYAPVVSELILRAMARARYDTNNIGHFALGNVPYYGHTTSPIRRSVDLITQSLIKKYQNGEFLKQPDDFHDWLQSTAEYASYKERQAKEAEMEVNKMRMAELMSKEEGRYFEAIISHINDSGAYARIHDVIEGKIYLKDIEGDHFYYDSRSNLLIGKKTKQTFRVGQKVLVQVKNASKEDRTINYSIPNTFLKNMENNKGERREQKKIKALARRKYS